MSQMSQPELEALMRDFAGFLQEHLPDYLFVLTLYHRYSNASNYISNGQRVDIVSALREMADKLEQHQDLPAIDPKQPIN